MKVFNYIIILTGMMLLLALAGFQVGAVNIILNTVGIAVHNATIDTSISWGELFLRLFQDDAIKGILMGVGVGIVVGLFMQGRLENFMILPFITGYLVFFVGAMNSLMVDSMKYGSLIGTMVIVILAPLTVGFLISLIEFFRGSD